MLISILKADLESLQQYINKKALLSKIYLKNKFIYTLNLCHCLPINFDINTTRKNIYQSQRKNLHKNLKELQHFEQFIVSTEHILVSLTESGQKNLNII